MRGEEQQHEGQPSAKQHQAQLIAQLAGDWERGAGRITVGVEGRAQKWVAVRTTALEARSRRRAACPWATAAALSPRA